MNSFQELIFDIARIGQILSYFHSKTDQEYMKPSKNGLKLV